MPPVTIDGSLGITTPMYNGSITANAVTPVTGFKNRIINGAMVISQRNGTSSVSETGAAQYTLDRWQVAGASPGVFSVAQSSTAPTGFINSLLITVTTADSSLSGASYQLQQKIEGLNCTDLAWGTASAQTVNLNFWVRSSLTGTFGGAVTNNAYDWTYPFSYTISAANTWEQKSVTITGATSGTWLTTNGNGIQLVFGLGAQVARKATAGVWANTVARQPTGSVDLIATNGATLFLTGVQLEVGSTATSFDYRPYGTELALCQRYLPVFNTNTITGAFSGVVGGGMAYSTSGALISYAFKVTPRTPPTGVTVSSASQFSLVLSNTGTYVPSAILFGDANSDTCILNCTGAAGLAAGDATFLRNNNATLGQILFTGCEL
jgi:hypothetical protein